MKARVRDIAIYHEIHGRGPRLLFIGGMVAQELAARCPERVERLVLACTSSGGQGKPFSPLHELQDLPSEARAAAGASDPGREDGFRRQLEARAGHDTWDRLASFPMPVYVCGGRYDGIAPPENQHAMAQQIPDAKLELFDGGHLFLMQDRRASPAIREFLLG